MNNMLRDLKSKSQQIDSRFNAKKKCGDGIDNAEW